MFYPKNAEIPDSLEFDDYVLLPITTTKISPLEYADDYEDHLAIQNDIKSHQQRKAFTFFLLNTKSVRPDLLGGVKINPGPPMLESSEKYQALINFWVTGSGRGKNLDKRLLTVLISWFKQEWAFDQVFFEPEMGHHRTLQIKLFTEAGLELKLGHEYGPDSIYG